MKNLSMHQRVVKAGYGHLWENYDLQYTGIVTLRCPTKLARPTVLSPESRDPLPGRVPWVKLTSAQCREVLWAMFGDDAEVAV